MRSRTSHFKTPSLSVRVSVSESLAATVNLILTKETGTHGVSGHTFLFISFTAYRLSPGAGGASKKHRHHRARAWQQGAAATERGYPGHAG